MMKLDSKELKRLSRSISIQTLLLGACFLLGAANFQSPYGLIVPSFYILGVIASIGIFVKESNKRKTSE